MKDNTEPFRDFIPPGWSLPQTLLAMRYVDDLLMSSGCLCHGCLARLVKQLYTVSFEVAEEACEQTWTDIVFRIDPMAGTVSWAPKNPNRLWIQGDAPKNRERYVPYLARLQCPFGLLRGQLLGRAARLQHMSLSLIAQKAVMLEELQELVLEGYPASLLRALSHALPLSNPVFFAVRKASRLLSKATKHDRGYD